MSNFQDSKTTIIIATISVIGTVIATLGNAVISNWQQIPIRLYFIKKNKYFQIN